MSRIRFLTLFFNIILTTSLLAFDGETSTESEILGSTQNPLAALYGVPETNIHGVNVINGDYNCSSIDFYLPGSDPLVFQRSYSTANTQLRAFFHGWTHNLCSVVNIVSTPHHRKAVTQGSLTGEIPYKTKTWNEYQISSYEINERILKKGVTNCGQGNISGRTNLKNTYLYTDDDATLYTGDGSSYTHKLSYYDGTTSGYYLEKVVKPTGCSAKYENLHLFLKKVTFRDWSGNPTKQLSCNLQSTEKIHRLVDNQTPFKFDIEAGDGRKVSYYFQSYKKLAKNRRHAKTICLEKIKSTHAPSETYYYTDQNGSIDKKLSGKEGRRHKSEIVYYAKNDVMHIRGKPEKIDSSSHIACNRVKQLNVAVNDKNRLERLCWFSYGKDKKQKQAFTDFYDEYNHLTRYVYSTEDHRLARIERYKGKEHYSPYRHDKMVWGEEKTADETNLIYRTIEDGYCNIHFAEDYTYDFEGNITTKISRYRTATSTQENPIYSTKSGLTGGEIKKVISSYDKNNMPISEDDGRLITKTSYLKKFHPKFNTDFKSNLVQRRLVKDRQGILKREFFDYDETASDILHVVDDGSSKELDDLTGVQKRILTKKVNLRGLFSGLPSEIATYGLDIPSNQEILIGRTEIDYDEHGFIKEKRVFDANDALGFTTYQTCDIQGNVLEEVDPLGQMIKRTFDKYRCCLFEKGPSEKFHKEFEYDLLQRPVQIKEVYNDGITFTTQKCYNLEGKLIQETGPYGEVTTNTYNEQKLLSSTCEPAIRTAYGAWERPKISKTYDLFGNLASETNAKGQTTTYFNTPDGKVLSIEHPEGTKEFFRYSIYGELIEKISSKGSKTLYTHDSQGRVLSETVFDRQGCLLKSHTYAYNGSLLSSENENGLISTYTYDHAGRIVKKTVGNKLSEFTFDPLGRQIEERVFYADTSDSCICHQKSYDLLNRVLTEQDVDASGKVHFLKSYTYDELGAITSITTQNHIGVAVTTKEYDPRGNLSLETDALGNTTQLIHRYDCIFEGQNLPCLETIDPSGVKTLTISDHHGHAVFEKIFLPDGETLSHTEMFYDLSGNLIEREHHLKDKVIKNRYFYDAFDRLILQIDGAGSEKEIRTAFIYNAYGELTDTLYQDGQSKICSYDDLGRLSDIRSSDGTLHAHYHYNAQDLPILVENCATSQNTTRRYSVEGSLLSETQENGLTISYAYDRIGREISCTFPDGSSLKRTYNPVYLEKTEKIQENKVLYSTEFKEHDLSGLPQKIVFPFNSGELLLNYDLLNRPISLQYPHYIEDELLFDPRGLLISKKVNHQLHTFSHDHLRQLTEEKSPTYLKTYVNDSLNRQIERDGVLQMHNDVNELIEGIHGEYGYDLRGNRIQDGAFCYAYDSFNRLIEISSPENSLQFTYDAFNRKLTCTHNGRKTHYLYDHDEEIGSYDDNLQNIDLKLLSSGVGSLPIALEINNQVFSPMISSNGHIVGLINTTTGTLANYSPLTMFGEDLSNTPLSPWRFCGKRHYASNLIDFGFRFYDARSCQWLNRDPIGEADGPNLYAYVQNSPAHYIDRFGLFAEDFEFGDSWNKSKSIATGICHGGVDFTMDTVQDVQSIAYKVGSYQFECNCFEREQFDMAFENSQIQQKDTLDQSLMSFFSIDESDTLYHSARSITKTSLEVASLAYGGFKALQGGYKLVCAIKAQRATASKITRIEGNLRKWLGPDIKYIKNKAQDPIFLSKDGLRKFRFDFNDPKPHLSPHCHLEKLIMDEWVDIAKQIYPIDLPHH